MKVYFNIGTDVQAQWHTLTPGGREAKRDAAADSRRASIVCSDWVRLSWPLHQGTERLSKAQLEERPMVNVVTNITKQSVK